MKALLIVALSVWSAHADFLWGTATAAYQVEGHRTTHRQPSIWDAFDTENISTVIKSVKPNGEYNVYHGQNAAIADSDYALYEYSAVLTKAYGFGAARLSIAWPRVMTYWKDKRSGELRWVPNIHGIKHYKSVLHAYKEKGVQTAVTMFHWDLPLHIEEFAAEMECKSAWLCHALITHHFEAYVDLLLREFGDLTDWWITLNEPLTVTENGYAGPSHAPGRCSNREVCYAGNVDTEPYLAVKGMILAHAHAFRQWEKYGRPGQGMGITLNGDWRIPYTDSDADRAAAQRSLEWQVAIFADPIHFGRWPASIEERVGARLPKWTTEEVKLVNNTHDGHFFMNHYTTNYARAPLDGEDSTCGWRCDPNADTSGKKWDTNEFVGTPSSNGWLFNYGPGLGELVNWYHHRYPGVSFIITENGWGNASTTFEDEMYKDDLHRCNYYHDYIGNLSKMATEKGFKVIAYFAWSLMDNYEWSDGFSVRFGLTYVDYSTMERTPKKSAIWFQKYVTPLGQLPTDGKPLPPCEPLFHDSSVIVV